MFRSWVSRNVRSKSGVEAWYILCHCVTASSSLLLNVSSHG